MKRHPFFAIISFIVTTTCTQQPADIPTQAKISIFGTSPISAIPPIPSTASPHLWLQMPPGILSKRHISLEQKVPEALALSGVWLMNKIATYLKNISDKVTCILPFAFGRLKTAKRLHPNP